jgi:hypothetical protein
MHYIRPTVAFAVSAAATWLLTLASPAQAYDRRVHAGTCQTAGSSAGYVLGFNGMRDTAAAGIQTVLSCAINEDSDHPAHLFTTMNVHVFNGGGSRTEAAACITFFNSNNPGGQCGPSQVTPTSFGEFTLQPSRSLWSAANYSHFKYVRILLGGNSSAIHGIFLAS